MDRTIWHHIRHFKNNIGETTPFSFSGRDVCLFNVSSINGAQRGEEHPLISRAGRATENGREAIKLYMASTVVDNNMTHVAGTLKCP